MYYKELIIIPSVADKLRFPSKTNRNLGPSKGTWCEFHKAFGHDVENCIALGYQLAELVRDDFLKEYLEEGSKNVMPVEDQGHEVPTHGEDNMIFGRFSGGGGCAPPPSERSMREK